jgi:hypothetical protein
MKRILVDANVLVSFLTEGSVLYWSNPAEPGK